MAGKVRAWFSRRIDGVASTAHTLYEDPRAIGPLIQRGLIGIWAARGGGFYGLGYLVTFIVLEIRLFVGEFAESDSVAAFITAQLLESVLRIGVMSFVNGFLALIWPAYVIDWFAELGLVLLIAGYFVFEKGLKPVIEARLPDLRTAREERRATREERRARRAGRKARRKARKGD